MSKNKKQNAESLSEEKVGMKKVLLIANPTGGFNLANHTGDTITVDADLAARMIDAKVAKEV